MRLATMRAVMSAEAPGVKPTMTRTGRDGKSSARPAVAVAARAIDRSAATR